MNISINFTSMDFSNLAERLKAMADPTRLRILKLLPPTDTCELVYNVSELAEELQIPQPTVSHHLKVLYNEGLVKCRKMCRDVYYWIDQDCVEKTLKQFGEIAKAELK